MSYDYGEGEAKPVSFIYCEDYNGGGAQIATTGNAWRIYSVQMSAAMTQDYISSALKYELIDDNTGIPISALHLAGSTGRDDTHGACNSIAVEFDPPIEVMGNGNKLELVATAYDGLGPSPGAPITYHCQAVITYREV